MNWPSSRIRKIEEDVRRQGEEIAKLIEATRHIRDDLDLSPYSRIDISRIQTKARIDHLESDVSALMGYLHLAWEFQPSQRLVKRKSK